MYPWLVNLFESLTTRYRAAKLHHGLLFMGAPDAGKQQLCEHLAKALLCKSVGPSNQKLKETSLFAPALEPTQAILAACNACKSCLLIDAGSHPDLHIITTEKSQIGIDAIRQAIAKVSQTAQLSGNKVIIIPKVELMSESASNALLKTLEEPTPNTYLLMTTNEAQRLLPTILSRCEKLPVALPTYDQSCEWLATFSIPAPTKMALQAHGSSPITYKNELEDPELIGFDDFTQTLKELLSGSTTANRAALKWQTEAAKASRWLAQHWIEEYKNTQKSLCFNNYQDCLSSTKRMSHPGLNKSLILTTLFAQVLIT